MTLKQKFEDVIAAVATRLLPQGVIRQGGVVLKKISGNAAIVVEFQKSRNKCSDDRIVFTVNTGLIRGELLRSLFGATNLRKAKYIDAHVTWRLGYFLPERSDKWWDLIASTELEPLVDELVEGLANHALPYYEKYLDADSLIKLWESGDSPGLTEGQRVRYLHQLKQAHGAGA